MHCRSVRALVAALAAAALLSGCLAASYQRWSAGRVGGYRDRELAPGHWEVTASTTNFNRPGFAGDMVVHRAADLASRAGFSHIRIVFARNVTNRLSVGYGAAAPVGSHFAGEDATVRVRGLNDPAAATECEMSACPTFPVRQAMDTLAPHLGIRRE